MMPQTATAAELFGTQTKTAADLFGPEKVDTEKVTGELPADKSLADRNQTSYRKIYEDVLSGNQNWDAMIPEDKRAELQRVDPEYEENGKRLINSAYLADLTGMTIEDAYMTHDQLAETLLKERTPSKAFDRIKNRYQNGKTQVKMMDIGYSALTGKLDNAVALQQIQQLRTELKGDYKQDLRWFGEQILGSTAEQIPNMWEAVKAAPVGAGGGAVIGALIAAVAGQLGPQAAAPEEVTTVPAAAGFGAKVGGGAAAANRVRELEAGGMYLELLEMKDENGNTVDPTIAATTAHIVGVINGGIELAEWAVLLETFGIGTKAFEKAATSTTSKIAARGTLKHLALKYSMKYGTSLTAEVLQELSQESTNIVLGELAKALNNEIKGTDIKPITKEELLDRYYEVTTESIKGFALLVAPGQIVSAGREFISRETPTVKLTQPVTPRTGPVEEQVYMKGFAARLTSIRNNADNLVAGAGKKSVQKKTINEELTAVQDHYQSIADVIEENKETLPELVEIQGLLPEYAQAVKNFVKKPSKEGFKKIKEFGDKIADLGTTYGERISTERAKEISRGIERVVVDAGPQAAVNAVYADPDVEVTQLEGEVTEQDLELTEQETADLTQLDALEAEENLYELQRVPKELRGKGIGYVIVEKATGKEAARIADRTQAKAKLEELNQAGKPVAERKTPRGLLTSKSKIGKVVKEYTALKAAFKKAAQAARKAFIAGRTEGIVRTKQHYAELKAREKARKALKDRIAKAVKAIKKSPPKSVDYFYRRLIEELQDRIDPMFRTTKTLARRQQMREFLQRATPEERADFPDKLAALLDKKPLNELTVEELESIADEIERLTKLGKVKLKARKAIEQSRLEKTVKRLTENADEVPVVPDAPRGIDYSRTGLREAIKNAYVWTLRMPRLMDWLDGRMGTFKGFWHETFYNSVNRQTDAELRTAETRHKSGMDKMKELNITMNELAVVDDYSTTQNGLHLSIEQQMGIYAALKNRLSLDAMVNGNKITLEVANSVVSNLEQKYKDFADYIIEEYQENYGRIRDVYVKLTNEDLGKEDFYTPIIRLEQNEHVAQQEIIDQLLERHGLKKGYVEKKFTIDRKNIAPEHQKPMDLRLVSVWQSQVQKQEHFIHFSELVKSLRKIMADTSVRSMVENKLGKQGKVVIDNYISRVANPNIYRAYDGLAGVSRSLRRNVAMSYLAYNLMTIAKQGPSLILYMKDAGPSAMLSSIWEFSQNPRSIWNMVRQKDPQVKNAFIERELEELRQQLPYIKDKDTVGKINRIINTVGNKGMIGIRFVDGIVRTIGWNAVYQKNLQLGLSEAEAALEAQNATLRTQPAAAPKDIAQLYATNEFLNWFTMFTNQLNNIWNITTYDMYAYWSDKNYQASAMTLMSVSANALIIWMLVNKKLPEDEKELLDAALDQSLNMLPLINGGAMVGKRGWGTLSPPPIQTVTETTKILSAADKEKQAIKALQSGLVLTGIPVSAIKRGYRFAETGNPKELFGGEQKKNQRIKF